MSVNQHETLIQKVIDLHHGIEGLRRDLAQRAEDQKLPERKAKNVTFNQSPQVWDSQGYPYRGIFVSQAQTLHIDYMGTKYDLSLAAGFNQVIIPDQAEVYTDANATFTGLVMWSATTFQ